MAGRKISDRVYAVGILNPILRIFDVVMETEYGTTYNSYIVKGADKIALVDTCHHTYWEQYLENIKDVCDVEKIDYIVLNHCEPDHSGVLAKLVECCPNAEIIASPAGSMYLKNITNKPELKIRAVKEGDKLELGDATLRFISAPFLHWPDSMFTWCEEEKTLFSCDFLGCHYCEPHDLDREIVYNEKYEDAFQYYYNAIFGPFASYVRNGLDKIKHLPIEFVCCSHGPIITRKGKLLSCLAQYESWSEAHQNQVKTIPIFYCSAYGNTGLLADAIAEGIHETIPEADVSIYDINEHDMGKLQLELNHSDAFAIGSPTINGDAVAPVWNLLSHVDAINNRKKPVLVFGSYGWSGEAIPNIKARLEGLKLKVFDEDCKVIFVPSEEDIQKAKEIGKAFAKTL